MTTFACRLDGIEPSKRDQHIASATQLFQSVTSVRELPDGYAFRLPEGADTLLKAAAFIDLERRCCPFFGLAIEIEPEGGPVWLHLRGPEGVKPFIRLEVREFMGEGSLHFSQQSE